MRLNETFNKFHVGKYLSDNFPIQNGLKQGDALLSLLYNFASDYAIRNAQESQVGLKLSGTQQLMIHGDDVDLLVYNIDIIKKNTQTLIDVSTQDDLVVNIEKYKHVLLSRHHNAGHNLDIKITNRCFKNVAQFKYLEKTVTNQNFIQEEIKRRMNLDNACYHSVQKLLSFRLLSRNIKTRIYKTTILLWFCIDAKLGLGH
jgi:hypothetical protein